MRFDSLRNKKSRELNPAGKTVRKLDSLSHHDGRGWKALYEAQVRLPSWVCTPLLEGLSSIHHNSRQDEESCQHPCLRSGLLLAGLATPSRSPTPVTYIIHNTCVLKSPHLARTPAAHRRSRRRPASQQQPDGIPSSPKNTPSVMMNLFRHYVDVMEMQSPSTWRLCYTATGKPATA